MMMAIGLETRLATRLRPEVIFDSTLGFDNFSLALVCFFAWKYINPWSLYISELTHFNFYSVHASTFRPCVNVQSMRLQGLTPPKGTVSAKFLGSETEEKS